MMSESDKDQQLIELLKNLAQEEAVLRQKFGIGDRYSYLPLKLNRMLSRLDARKEVPNQERPVMLPPWVKRLADDEVMVHVYLYHSKGHDLRSWERMLLRGALEELGVNRPVYEHRYQAEKFLDACTNKHNHAYVSVIVKANELIHTDRLVDSLGQPVTRLIGGSVNEDKIVDFVNYDTEYFRDQHGRLIKKEDFISNS